MGLSLGEEVPDPCGPDAHEHFDEVGATQAEERDGRLPGHGLGEQGLPGPGLAGEQHALGDLPSQPAIALRVLEKVHNFHQLRPRLVDPGHILERHTGAPLHVHLRLAFADGHEPALAPHPAHQDHPQAKENQGRKHPGEQHGEPGILHAPAEADLRGLKLGDQPRIVHAGRDKAMLPFAVALQLLDLLLREDAFEPFR